jgi:hypothetical protein
MDFIAFISGMLLGIPAIMIWWMHTRYYTKKCLSCKHYNKHFCHNMYTSKYGVVWWDSCKNWTKI